MSRKTATIEQPTTQPQTEELEALAAARSNLALAEDLVKQAAQHARTAQEMAVAPALAFRDAEYLRQTGILLADDPGWQSANEENSRARKVLDNARTALHRAEQERDRATEACTSLETATDRVRRRQWAEENNLDLALQLMDAQQEVLRLQANPYVGSPQGMNDLRSAQAQVAALNANLDRAAEKAPSADA